MNPEYDDNEDVSGAVIVIAFFSVLGFVFGAFTVFLLRWVK
jgi:hypothetical protein